MLYYALIFLLIAILAGVRCFGGVAVVSAGIAKILFFVFNWTFPRLAHHSHVAASLNPATDGEPCTKVQGSVTPPSQLVKIGARAGRSC